MNIKANPEVTYMLEGFFPDRNIWVIIHSDLKEKVDISELLDQLKIDPKCPRSPATAFRMVQVTRDVVQFMEVVK
ncbi:hypothetical protein pEaSNUABM28_00284 [Erwinia phage pEa_SNUABM_28]|uniref:Uncharacterized protein n=1 Tax=Erwinia phage pEa_SNUABM_16 TaxID=2869544 RepID=A0AAE8XRB8_9CAUD|nr:hypothetical protein MPK64_gp282 [Erwinia phage pEa_SNUABM_16]QZE58841.1 hypothetical protein pEaSNUABM28_00284 [Erwinia phage pEa_SNUABM_28]QZE59185.1 hypothetical protein pEaSNUABM18_00282 [Erwinia phage pEa_SNUABM_18]UAW96426.1 hypothetical protein pEaSNUABM16_00282 [Erwinia phage pEa_SNUABM_16]